MAAFGTTTLAVMVSAGVAVAVFIRRLLLTWKAERQSGAVMTRILKDSLRWSDLIFYCLLYILFYGCFIGYTIYTDHEALKGRIRTLAKERNRFEAQVKEKEEQIKAIKSIVNNKPDKTSDLTGLLQGETWTINLNDKPGSEALLYGLFYKQHGSQPVHDAFTYQIYKTLPEGSDVSFTKSARVEAQNKERLMKVKGIDVDIGRQIDKYDAIPLTSQETSDLKEGKKRLYVFLYATWKDSHNIKGTFERCVYYQSYHPDNNPNAINIFGKGGQCEEPR